MILEPAVASPEPIIVDQQLELHQQQQLLEQLQQPVHPIAHVAPTPALLSPVLHSTAPEGRPVQTNKGRCFMCRAKVHSTLHLPPLQWMALKNILITETRSLTNSPCYPGVLFYRFHLQNKRSTSADANTFSATATSTPISTTASLTLQRWARNFLQRPTQSSTTSPGVVAASLVWTRRKDERRKKENESKSPIVAKECRLTVIALRNGPFE